MSYSYRALVDHLRETLTQQRYNPVAIQNYCRNADYFLSHLAERKIAIEAVTQTIVSDYLHLAVRQFRKRHGHAPARYWISIPRSGIYGLLKLALKRWPPEPAVTGAGERLCREVCDQYQTWLREQRGLADASIYALMWEGRYFCAWYINRSGTASFAKLSARDLDAYMEMRAPGLTRRSLKDVAERLRSLLKHLHREGHIVADLAPHVIAPLLYAYEGIPSALSSDQIATVLEFVRKDRSQMGLRDYAILQLLATYGLRSGEITRLRLDDIDWRSDILNIRHSKSGAHSRRASRVIVGRVRSQQMAKMPFAEHDNVVKTFPSDRTNRPFTISVLPRRSRRGWPIPNAHRPKAADEDVSVDGVRSHE